jgi:hypothetical protein
MRIRLPAILVAFTSAASAQTVQLGRAAVAADSVPTTIALAEAEGARYPRSTVPDSTQVQVRWRQSAGTSEHRCVEAAPSGWVRSGDISVAGFEVYRELWHTGWGKLAWTPDHPTPSSPVLLVVRASRLDQSAPAWVFETSGLAHAAGSSTDYGYPTGFHLPTVGRWRMVARAGANWGCFIYNLT